MSEVTPITLSYSGKSIDLGIINGYSDKYQISLTSAKIPMLPSDKQFCMDNGVQNDKMLSYFRTQPEVTDDSSTDSKKWSNRKWVNEMTRMVDRWQADTDGCTLTYNPPNPDEFMKVSLNVYITRFTIQYTNDAPEEVKGQISLKAGTMMSGRSVVATIRNADMSITMCDGNNSSWYYLWQRSSGTSCIDSLEIHGGMNQPFESLVMKIPRRRLTQFAPELMGERGIVSGRNVIIYNAYGYGRFILTKASLKNDIYTITGYAVPEVFRGTPTAYRYTNSNSPMQIIEDILSIGVSVSGGNESASYRRTNSAGNGKLNTNLSDTIRWSGTVDFPAGTNAWYVLQVCAMRMGARIWFAEGDAYLYDMRNASSTTSIDLQSGSYARNVVGSPSLGDEGTSSIVNNVQVGYTTTASTSMGDDRDKTVTISVRSNVTQSQDYYGVRKGNTMHLKEIRNEADAVAIAQGYMAYLTDSQNSITFTLKEMVNGGWARSFNHVTWASKIVDDIDDITVTNVSPCTKTTKPNLLTLSSFARIYPEGYSEYTFGAQNSIDLSSRVSQILNVQNNG
jgi:hypothetical protein